MNTFELIITSYNDISYQGQAVHCGVNTTDGALGLEAKHEPLLCVLKDNSSITYKDPSGKERSIKIKNGMLSFKNNICTIVVSGHNG